MTIIIFKKTTSLMFLFIFVHRNNNHIFVALYFLAIIQNIPVVYMRVRAQVHSNKRAHMSC